MGVQIHLNSSSPCPRSSLSLPVLLLSLLSPSQDTTSWRSLAVVLIRSSSALEKLKLPGTTVGTLLTSWAASVELWELQTVEPVSVMFLDGWDSWSARYSINNMFEK